MTTDIHVFEDGHGHGCALLDNGNLFERVRVLDFGDMMLKLNRERYPTWTSLDPDGLINIRYLKRDALDGDNKFQSAWSKYREQRKELKPIAPEEAKRL